MERLIVFDLDGTLSDSRESIVRCFLAAFDACGLTAPPQGAIAGRIGLPLAVMCAEMTPGAPSGAAAALEASYRENYLAFDARYTRVFPGIPELLGGLRGPLAVATSKSTAGAERSLRDAGLRERFSIVLGRDAVVRGKPAPDMLHEALRLGGVPPERAVMVGDTTFDLEMADAAGVPAIGVSWGVHDRARLSRWRVAQSVAELGALLGAGPPPGSD